MRFFHLAHIAFHVSDLDRTLDFYFSKLGLRHVYTMTHGQRLEKTGHALPPGVRAEDPWITYLEFAPRQFIELFSPLPGMRQNPRDDKAMGYLHLPWR